MIPSTLILGYLKAHHPGPSRAIPRDQLMGLFGMDPKDMTQDREFREWYSSTGIPTCNEGLYWPRGKEDRENFAHYLWNHVNPKAHAVRMAAFDARFPDSAPEQGEQLRLGI